jgi:hypothetical protein
MSIDTGLPNIFQSETVSALYKRMDDLQADAPALWGKMNVSQMLAHCCIPFEQALGMRSDGPNLFMKLLLRIFFKNSMVNEVPYRPNLPTAPSFVIDNERNIEVERSRLKMLLGQFNERGESAFDGKKQISLGSLSALEWNNLMYKHLDHHLRQFGV